MLTAPEVSLKAFAALVSKLMAETKSPAPDPKAGATIVELSMICDMLKLATTL